jgi:hypothetical protein
MQRVCRTLRTLQISTSAQNSRKATKPSPPLSNRGEPTRPAKDLQVRNSRLSRHPLGAILRNRDRQLIGRPAFLTAGIHRPDDIEVSCPRHNLAVNVNRSCNRGWIDQAERSTTPDRPINVVPSNPNRRVDWRIPTQINLMSRRCSRTAQRNDCRTPASRIATNCDLSRLRSPGRRRKP